MKTKLEPVHSTISWYTWAKNMFLDFVTVFNLAYCYHKSHFLAETDHNPLFQNSYFNYLDLAYCMYGYTLQLQSGCGLTKEY